MAQQGLLFHRRTCLWLPKLKLIFCLVFFFPSIFHIPPCNSSSKMSSKIFFLALALSSTFFFVNARLLHHRHLSELLPDAPLILPYHNGPLLSGNGAINVFLIWYGSFSSSQRSIVKDFLVSFSSKNEKNPSVNSWWRITSGYKDSSGKSVPEIVRLAAEYSFSYSLGKNLKKNDLESLLKKNANSRSFSADSKDLYIILTSDDVYVEGFCVQTCASHSSIKLTKDHQLPYAWVGNSATQCAGKCAWPFASAKKYFGPDTKPLIAPNGDTGMDGMIINMATIIAGAATNPFSSGYFQGDATAPLEAATACTGIFGSGAYSGFPGNLMVDQKTGASFNAYGIGSRMFLLPALWSPSTTSCIYPKP